MQDGAPAPKVIDFGIAKATQQRLTEKTFVTALGDFMGTPAYMSPEQAEMSVADIDLLATSHDQAGRRDEALTMWEDMLALRRKVLGSEHPDTIKAMNSLAPSYYQAGRIDDATKLWEKALTLSRKVFGSEDPETLTPMNCLVACYEQAGPDEEALKLRKEALEIKRKQWPNDPAKWMTDLTALAEVRARTGRWKEEWIGAIGSSSTPWPKRPRN
jgi:tetratricopeptide (TPR) repeat protein